MTSLAEALPKEIERARDILKIYESVGVAGSFASAMIRNDIKAAEVSIMSGDVVAMLQAYKALQGISV